MVYDNPGFIRKKVLFVKKMIAVFLVLFAMLTICGCVSVTVEKKNDQPETMKAEPKGCDHSFSVEGIFAAGCDFEGNVTVFCQLCGQRYSAVQAALGHDWAEADCTVPVTCKVCGVTQGDVLPHTFTNGECSLCGAPDPDNSISWDLSKGVLTLTGVGRMKDDCPWWDYRSSIKEIVISEGITYIGQNAFHGAEITEAILPDSVTEIGVSAFYWIDELTKVVLPDGIEVLPDRVFGQCSNLSDVKFPAGLKKIGNYALGACAIVDLELPEGLEEIGESAFAHSRKLTAVEIPGSVVLIDKSAFANCSSLSKVVIEEGALSIGYKAFGTCEKLMEVHIPASVTTIDEYAFEESTNVVIYGKAGSYAQTFAAENGIRFIAE